MKRDEVTAYLVRVPMEELLAVLQEVFEARTPNPEEAAYNRNRFFLGTASSVLGSEERQDWGPWEIHAVAYIDRDEHPEGLGPDWGFCEFGTCESCGTHVRSNVKRGICPVCGDRVSMT